MLSSGLKPVAATGRPFVRNPSLSRGTISLTIVVARAQRLARVSAPQFDCADFSSLTALDNSCVAVPFVLFDCFVFSSSVVPDVAVFFLPSFFLFFAICLESPSQCRPVFSLRQSIPVRERRSAPSLAQKSLRASLRCAAFVSSSSVNASSAFAGSLIADAATL